MPSQLQPSSSSLSSSSSSHCCHRYHTYTVYIHTHTKKINIVFIDSFVLSVAVRGRADVYKLFTGVRARSKLVPRETVHFPHANRWHCFAHCMPSTDEHVCVSVTLHMRHENRRNRMAHTRERSASASPVIVYRRSSSLD